MNAENDYVRSAIAGKRRVLLVEDDEELAEVLKALLEWHHFEVVAVHRGAAGLAAIINSHFDAIVCDMVMPVMSGDMFYLAVYRVKPHLCSRFVFITGYGDHPVVERFLWRTRQPHLFKPIDTNQLVSAISDVIEFTSARVIPPEEIVPSDDRIASSLALPEPEEKAETTAPAPTIEFLEAAGPPEPSPAPPPASDEVEVNLLTASADTSSASPSCASQR